jgi:hypothetical protein
MSEVVTYNQKRCSYIFKAGDKKVEAGDCQVGDRCGNFQYIKEYEIFDDDAPDTKYMVLWCHGHYNQWRAMHRPQEIAEETTKRLDTIAKQKENAIEKHDTLMKEAASNPEKFGVDIDIIKAMGLDEDCNLENELVLYKMLPCGDGQDSYAEKMAYARWVSTPELKRIPKTNLEAATILGVKQQTLELWRRSPEMAKMKSRNAETWLENAYPLIIHKTLSGCNRLDPRFFEIYRKLRADAQAKAPTNKFPVLPDNIVKMAEKRNEESGRSILHGSLNEIEKSAVFGAARDGDMEIAK